MTPAIINRVKALVEAYGRAVRNHEASQFGSSYSVRDDYKQKRDEAESALLSDLEKLLAAPSEEEIDKAAEALWEEDGVMESTMPNSFRDSARAAITTFLKGRGV